MRLLSSLVALVIAGALSLVWIGEGPTDTYADGVDITAQNAAAEPGAVSSAQQTPQTTPITDGYAAAVLSLQAAIDVWHHSSGGVLSDPSRLAEALGDAQQSVQDGVAAQHKADEKARQEASAEQEARPVSPPLVYQSDDDDDDVWDDWDDWDDSDDDDDSWDD